MGNATVEVPVLTLVGVGHVFDLRRQVREVILARRPGVVGLELDRARFAALQQGGRRGGPPLYLLMSLFQKRVADMYGTNVGAEMLAAAQAAKDVGARVALLDRDSLEMFRACRDVLPASTPLSSVTSSKVSRCGCTACCGTSGSSPDSAGASRTRSAVEIPSETITGLPNIIASNSLFGDASRFMGTAGSYKRGIASALAVYPNQASYKVIHPGLIGTTKKLSYSQTAKLESHDLKMR